MRQQIKNRPGIILILIALLMIGGATIQTDSSSAVSPFNQTGFAPPVSFDYDIIDPYIGGDVKLVGDIDNDGYADFVIGGMPGEGLNWYRYPDYQKTVIHIPDVEFTTDGAIGDVDGDGDLDIIVPDGNSGSNLRWLENPLPGGDPFTGSDWTEHSIGSIGNWGKDVYVADYDNNNRLDVATREQNTAMIFFQTGPNSWSKITFSGVNLGTEGMASGRVDSDNNEDLVLRGTWLKNPGGSAAQTAANWTEYTIGPANTDFKALVADVDMDGISDVLFSSSENTDEVAWWEPTTGNPTGAWTKHTIFASLDKVHTIQVQDMDLDGDKDVVLAQMHTSVSKEIMVMENLNGAGTSWQKQVIDNTGLHNGVVTDVGNDGDYDIFGANWTGNSPVKLYVNQAVQYSLDSWTYKQVSAAHSQTFGMAFGDVNGDGPLDIISGPYWYKNPGGNMTGSWSQSPFPANMEAILFVDVDGDNLTDIIAQKNDVTTIGVYWLEATNAAGTNWNSVQIGSVPAASHNLGAQGYRTGQVEPGGRPEVLISSGDGIYYFRIPANPGTGSWPRVKINGNPSDEGFALGDIDRDFLLDVAATTGDSKRVEWYKNPGNGTANWTAYHIGDFSEALFPDRTEIGDVNNDNRLDIIVSEENGNDSGAETYWWAAPSNPTSGNWSRTLIVQQATTNSMDAADMNNDNVVDIILGEHRGPEKVAVWENNGSGGLTENTVGTGRESHLGAQTADLDRDGDLDIVSIAYDDWQFVHLWRNDGAGNPPPTPTVTPTSPPGSTPTSTQTATSTSPASTPTSTPTITSTPPACEPLPTITPILPGTQRVTDGIQVLYLFEEGSGDTVTDVSGENPPINLTIANASAVSWITNGGLSVNSGTIIENGTAATRLFNALTSNNEVTLEAWVKPANITQNGPARILTLSEDPFLRNFTLGQEFDTYEIRLRTTTTDDNGFPPVASPGGGAKTTLSHVVYTRRSDGQATLYIDDTVVATETRDGNFSNWANQYHLALVNELTQDRAWLGELHLVAIFDRDLSAAEVTQNYEAGPHPVEEPGTVRKSYIPAMHSVSPGNCLSGSNNQLPNALTQVPVVAGSNGENDVVESAVNDTTNTSTTTVASNGPVIVEGLPFTMFYFIGLIGILLIVGLVFLGIYNNRANQHQ